MEHLTKTLRLIGHEAVLLAVACAIALPVYLELQVFHHPQAVFAAPIAKSVPAPPTLNMPYSLEIHQETS